MNDGGCAAFDAALYSHLLVLGGTAGFSFKTSSGLTTVVIKSNVSTNGMNSLHFFIIMKLH